MKTIRGRDLQKRIRSVMETAQNDQVVITRNGQPIAVVVGVEGADWETVAVETSRSFWKEIARRRDRRPSPSPRSASGFGNSPQRTPQQFAPDPLTVGCDVRRTLRSNRRESSSPTPAYALPA